MTLEEAIKRVASVEWANPADGEMQEAFALVLAAVKRPRVYALGEEERRELRGLLHWCSIDHGRGKATPQEMAALTAALSLEQPEEPFTVEELRLHLIGLQEVQEALAHWETSRKLYEDIKSAIAKLRAYIEKKEKE